MKAKRGFNLALITFLVAAFSAGAAERLVGVVQRVVTAPDSGKQSGTNTAQNIRLVGTVVDGDGKPLSEVVVERYQSGLGGPLTTRDMELKQKVVTGTNGSFEFSAPRALTLLFAHKPGFAPGWNQYWNPSKALTEEQLVLTPPTTISGLVVDESDKPVADAEVKVSRAYSERRTGGGSFTTSYLERMPIKGYFTSRTTSEGRFKIEGVPTNAAVDLAVIIPGKVLREPQRDYISPETMRARAGEQDVKLVVEPGAGLEGKVVAQDTDNPLAGARVSAQLSRPGAFLAPEPAESGPDGAFSLPSLAAGDYRLRAAFGTNAFPEWVADTVPVTVESGKITRDIKITATHGGVLEVAVVSKTDRQPLPQVGVSAYRASYQAGAAADGTGLARLKLPPGEYQVSAARENTRSEVTKVTVELDKTNSVEIELSPPPKIAGVVRDSTGSPVPGLKITTFPNWGPSSGTEAKTDANGRYEMTWNPQRYGGPDTKYCLIARDLDRNLAVAHEIDEGVTTVDLTLQPGLKVIGHVEDANGKPLTNATATLILWSGNSGSQFDTKPIKADSTGRFEISALPPDRKYSVSATAKGYGSMSQNVQDPETNHVELPPFTLKVADHPLAGQVVDADEKPVVGAYVHMYGEGQPNGSVRTDKQGRFAFAQVCEGSIRLSASAQSAFGNVQAQAGDTNVLLRLRSSSSYVSRQAPARASLKGKPLPDLSVVSLAADCLPKDKPVILCLFDLDQRPSRRFIKQLAEQHESLKQKGVTVLGLQAAVTTDDSFKEWKESSSVPFPVGRVAEKSEKTKWGSGVESLPYLILTDPDHRVADEGFALEDLEAKLKSVVK